MKFVCVFRVASTVVEVCGNWSITKVVSLGHRPTIGPFSSAELTLRSLARNSSVALTSKFHPYNLLKCYAHSAAPMFANPMSDSMS
jgi:hypothetical protein